MGNLKGVMRGTCSRGGIGKSVAIFGSLLFASSFATPTKAKAAVADELDRFAKCHLQFTGEIVSPDNAQLALIRNGKLGLKACEELLSTANLVGGTLTNGASRAEGKKILHTFNLVNNGFFVNLPQKSGSAKVFYDSNDRSYYLLKAMFSTDSSGNSNYKIQNIFSDPITYRGVREGTKNGYRLDRVGAYDTSVYGFALPFPRCGDGGSQWNQWGSCTNYNYEYSTIDPRIFAKANIDVSTGVMRNIAGTQYGGYVRDNGQLLMVGGQDFRSGSNSDINALYNYVGIPMSLNDATDMGTLVGLEATPARSIPNVQNRLFNDSDGYWRNHLGPAFAQPYPAKLDNMFDNLGTGILFTPNYQERLGLDTDNIAMQNGVDKIPRIWTQDVLKDFLCREIPVIRTEDAAGDTQAVLNPLAPFRAAVSCMRCHATIDNLSFIARNYQYSNSAPFSKGVMVNRFHKPTAGDMINPPNIPDPFFPVRPARGAFRYRDYKGNSHSLPLVSTAADPQAAFRQFASYLSQMEDPYACIAGKYFKYFTGIEPKFFDPGDPDAPVLSARDKALQEYVMALGKYLKDTGDLRKTILDIVSSQLYLDPLANSIK
jgi:hypothetical protein